MLLNFISDYLKHRFTAKTRHGTHSPFVYKLADEVIYNIVKNPVYSEIESYRKQLLNDQRTITITDLGAGSLLNNNKKKRISEIAHNALKRPSLAQVLFRITENLKPASIIELGTCLGVTTAYLSKACPSAKIVTIEGCAETARVAAEGFEKLGLNNVELQVGNFDNLFPPLLKKMEVVDLVYIDGNHTKDATLSYFNLCLEKVHDNSVLIFDDIYWSEGMKEAWEAIKNHPQVTITIDLFWIGLVYFKKDQALEHFKLKV